MQIVKLTVIVSFFLNFPLVSHAFATGPSVPAFEVDGRPDYIRSGESPFILVAYLLPNEEAAATDLKK